MTAGASDDASRRLPHPVALFVVAAAVGIVAALAIGFSVGALMVGAGTSDCSPSDGWCELGAAVIGVLIGAAAGTIAYIVGGVMTIVRCRPDGARSRHIIAHLLLPVATLALGSVAGGILG